MTRRFIDPDTGESLQWPRTRKQAIEHNFPRYQDGSPCPKCRQPTSRFVKTDHCYMCQFAKCLGLQAMVHNDKLWNHGTLMCQIEHNTFPHQFSDEDYLEMLEMKWRIDDDKSLRVHHSPCKKAGHLNVTRGGKCITCSERRSPRKEAIEKGEDWYLPDQACKNCGKVALKRVNNGQCKGCHPSSEKNARRDAINKGNETYMGRDCLKCGSDVRYTLNGKCVRCS